MILRAPLLLAVLTLFSQCRRARAPEAPPPSADAGTRTRVEPVAPPGPTADRRELDVPLSWIYLLTDPSPPGRTPNAVVGARIPCGYAPLYLTAAKEPSAVRVRLRARWTADGPVPAVLPSCSDHPPRAFLVSLGVLRLGDWNVSDLAPHTADDVPAPTARVQHVIPDDARMPPLVDRWVRGCNADADCTGGGVCASVDGGRLCLPELDPWLGSHASCVEGATEVDVTHAEGDGAVRTWRACVAACDHGSCGRSTACSPHGLCLPTQGTVLAR